MMIVVQMSINKYIRKGWPDTSLSFRGCSLSGCGAAAISISRLPSNAHRWIGEMEEIGSTYYANELNAGVFDNASYIYKLISKNKTKLIKLLETLD